MKKILIADSNKASLVMTSEIFKDHYPGVQVCTAYTSKAAIQIAREQKNFDAFIIDFDLPDLNGAQTALKIKRISKTPVIITAFENKQIQDALDSQQSNLSNPKIFLKKPLQSDIVRAVCELQCKNNLKFQKAVSSHLNAIACLVSLTKASSVKDVKNHLQESIYFPIFIEECALNAIKFKIHTFDLHPPLNNASIGDNIVIRFQNPGEIELGKIIRSEQLIDLKQDELLNLFPFELTGKIVLRQNDDDQPKQDKQEIKQNVEIEQDDLNKSLWVEFTNISLSKRIFEAVIREKMHEQFKMPYIKWYMG